MHVCELRWRYRSSKSYHSKHAVSFRVSNHNFKDKKTWQQFVSNVKKRKIDTTCIVHTVNLEELAKLTTIKITIRMAVLIGIILIIGLFL